MFERFTEKARRVIFFARYEASQYGSDHIESEHILLGMVREDAAMIARLLPSPHGESVRKQVDAHTTLREKVSTSVDLPLSEESKRILRYGSKEADRFGHRDIGTQHLLLGMVREKRSFAAQLVKDSGADLTAIRSLVEGLPAGLRTSSRAHDPSDNRTPPLTEIVEIHGTAWNAEYIREAVKKCREYKWHWQAATWLPQDIVINTATGAGSFDLALAETEGFGLVKGGWKKDRCAICRWDLFESPDDATHCTGYTNGREWVCTECFEKFLKDPRYFTSSYADLT